MKRKLEELEDDREFLVQLVSALRESSRTSVLQVLNLIRSNASFQEIKTYIEKHLDRDPASTLELDRIRQLQGADERARGRIGDTRKLSDTPLWFVPAKPWTRVTDDDEFVSHLLSYWFTWYNPIFTFIDRDAFIKDMQAGNLDSQFCTPFLVNAILADACVRSNTRIFWPDFLF